jgi:ASC-1-like (ASCH) protein
MTCKYLDCGWCYAPSGVETNNSQGECIHPECCPYLKQMEPKIEMDPSLILKSGDCIYYHGVKYQKVVEPKSFYNKLWDLLKTKLNNTLDCDELTDEVIDLIRDTIPEPMENKYHSDIIQGYNTAIKDIKERF